MMLMALLMESAGKGDNVSFVRVLSVKVLIGLILAPLGGTKAPLCFFANSS